MADTSRHHPHHRRAAAVCALSAMGGNMNHALTNMPQGRQPAGVNPTTIMEGRHAHIAVPQPTTTTILAVNAEAQAVSNRLRCNDLSAGVKK